MKHDQKEILRLASELGTDFEYELRVRFAPGEKVDYVKVFRLMLEFLYVRMKQEEAGNKP